MNAIEHESAADLQAKAEAWFARQCAISEKALGARWPVLRVWVEDYLRQEIKERLIARGWRPK
jgi:hypothetical protein